MLYKLIDLYLKLLLKTCKINVDNVNIDDGIIGFWHEDSFAMMLLLNYLEKQSNVNVLITEGKRGEIISKLIEDSCNSAVVLKHDKKTLKRLTEICKSEASLALPLDGPLGPRRVCKPIANRFAMRYNKKRQFVNVEYNFKLALRRWDKYRVVLPFSTLNITVAEILKFEE